MVFNLLMFFLVATRFAEEERSMEIALPAASAAVPLTVRPKEIFVNVDKDDGYFIARAEVTAQQLFDVLRQASEGTRDPLLTTAVEPGS